MKQILYKLFEHQYLGRDEARTILPEHCTRQIQRRTSGLTDNRLPDAQHIGRGTLRIP